MSGAERLNEAVAQAVTAAGLYLPVDGLFLVKRGDKKNRGSLTPMHKDGTPNGRGFAFQLRERDGEPAVVWESVSNDLNKEIVQ